MTLDKVENLTLSEMKLIAKEIGVAGFGNVGTKDKMFQKIKAHMEQFGLEEVPDIQPKDTEEEPVVLSNRPTPMAKKRIKDFPKKAVVILSRDPEIVDYPFTVNEYSCLVQMNKTVLLPEPVIDFIKSITEVYFRKDPDTGFSKHEELPKFIVNYV